MIRTPRPERRTVRWEVSELLIAGRWVTATLESDVTHYPAQVYLASLCYYDSPPDPEEIEVHATEVIEWFEYDADGEDLPRVLTAEQVATAALALVQDEICL